MTRNIKLGDVLFRYLPEYQVWHTGIVTEINKYHWDHIYINEFDESNFVSRATLRQYMWGRKYFWVARFREEMESFGPSVFRPLKERIEIANNFFKNQTLQYTINRYNCEYYVRRCVFNDSFLWESPQTKSIGESRAKLGLKLFNMFLSNIEGRIVDNKEYESNEKKDEYKYVIENGIPTLKK